MPEPKVKCGTCQGSRAQHLNDDDGCWCPRCMKTGASRCREFVPQEVHSDGRPKVNRKVAPVGHRHPSTAHEAARKAKPSSGTRRYTVYRLIEAAGTTLRQGMTDDELEAATGRSHQSVSATRNTLMNDGLIEDSGLRRRTQWGNDAIVWKVAPRD